MEKYFFEKNYFLKNRKITLMIDTRPPKIKLNKTSIKQFQLLISNKTSIQTQFSL